jgi:hypothetical protein
MPWYDDRTRTEFVGTYASPKQLQWDVDLAARRGWTVQPEVIGSGGTATLVDVGAPATSSKGERITVTFVRSPDWLAKREREISDEMIAEATHAADEKEARLVKALDVLSRSEQAFTAAVQHAAEAEGPAREQAERLLLAALKDLVLRRQQALRSLSETIREMDAAVAVGAAEFATTVASYRRSLELSSVRLEYETQLLETQEALTRTVRSWREAFDRKQTAEAELAKRTAEFESRDSTLKDDARARDGALNALPTLTGSNGLLRQ